MRMSLFVICLTLFFSFSVEANKSSSEKTEKRQPASSGSFHCDYTGSVSVLPIKMNESCDPSKSFSISRAGSSKHIDFCCILK